MVPPITSKKFWYKVFHSFIPAAQGIVSAFGERNMRVHGLAFIVVVIASLLLGLDKIEFVFITLAIGLVMAAEMINTAIEELCNIVRDELSLGWGATKRARDIAAGAVLVLTVVAILIAGTVFLPKLLALYPRA